MIVSIASGKGGTGKTTVATSMALALQAYDNEVTFLDCDVEEPNGHIFLKPDLKSVDSINIEVPEINEDICTHCGKCADICAFNALLVTGDAVIIFNELCHGCGGCQYFCEAKAVTMVPQKIGIIEKGYAGRIKFARGRLEVGSALTPPVVDAVKQHGDSRGSTILDAPPGTSCPVIHSVRESDFCLLVAEPTPFGLNDLDLAVQMIQSLNVPCGVLINRASDSIDLIEKYCHAKGLPVLLKIPLSKEVAEAYSRGVPLVEVKKEWPALFIELYRNIQELVTHERNNHH